MWFGDMDIAVRFFQSYNEENGFESLHVFEVRAERWQANYNGASEQSLLGMNRLQFVDVIVYVLICLWCV
jgi:hypothetical protein